MEEFNPFDAGAIALDEAKKPVEEFDPFQQGGAVEDPLDATPLKIARQATPRQQLAAQQRDIAEQETPFLSKAAARIGSGLEKGMATPERMIRGALDFLGYYKALDAVMGTGNQYQDYNKSWLEHFNKRDEQLRKEDEKLGAAGFGYELLEGGPRAIIELPPQLLGGAAGAVRNAAVKGAALTAGATSGLSQFAQDRGEGRGQLESGIYAALSGTITGLTTAAFGASGVESIFKKEGIKGVGNRILNVLKQSGLEGAEEATDQFQQDLLERIARNPNKPIEQSVNEVLLAGSIGGLIGGAVAAVHGASETAGDLIQKRREDAAFDEEIANNAKRVATLGTMPGVGLASRGNVINPQLFVNRKRTSPPGSITPQAGTRIQRAFRNRPETSTEAEIVAPPTSPQPHDEWIINVTPPQKRGEKQLPGYVQVDMMTNGVNQGSTNPKDLRAQGVEFPDAEQFYGLPKGKYTWKEANAKLKELESPAKAFKPIFEKALADGKRVNGTEAEKLGLKMPETHTALPDPVGESTWWVPKEKPADEKAKPSPEVAAPSPVSTVAGKPAFVPAEEQAEAGVAQPARADQAVNEALKASALPAWLADELKRRGIDSGRTFNDIDLGNQSVRDAIKMDPTLTDAQKKLLLETGSLKGGDQRGQEEMQRQAGALAPQPAAASPEAAVPKLKNHVAVYGGKEVVIDYVDDKKREFRVAAQRVSDNLKAGEKGYVKSPDGKIYEITRESRKAKLVQEIPSQFVPQLKQEAKEQVATPDQPQAPIANELEQLQTLRDIGALTPQQANRLKELEDQQNQPTTQETVSAKDVGPRLEGYIQTRLKGKKLNVNASAFLKKVKKVNPELYAQYQKRLEEQLAIQAAGPRPAEAKLVKSAPSRKQSNLTDADGKLFDIIANVGKVPAFMPPGWVASRYAKLMRTRATGGLLTSDDKAFLEKWFPKNYEDNWSGFRRAYDAAVAARIENEVFAKTQSPPTENALHQFIDYLAAKYGGDWDAPKLWSMIETQANEHASTDKASGMTQSEKSQLTIQEQQALDFENALTDTANTDPVDLDGIQVGAKWTLKGNPLEVTDVLLDEEDGSIEGITLDGGSAYGEIRTGSEKTAESLLTRLRMDKGSFVAAEAGADFLTPEDEKAAEPKKPVEPEKPKEPEPVAPVAPVDEAKPFIAEIKAVVNNPNNTTTNIGLKASEEGYTHRTRFESGSQTYHAFLRPQKQNTGARAMFNHPAQMDVFLASDTKLERRLARINLDEISKARITEIVPDKPAADRPKPDEPANLSPRQLKRLSELVKKQRAAEEGGGPVLTPEENKELSDLRSVGQADLLAEPEGANEAAQRKEAARLRAKAEELLRQSGFALDRYHASKVQDVAAKHRDDANRLAQEAAAARAEADQIERRLRGEKPQKPPQQDDMFGGRDASLPQSDRKIFYSRLTRTVEQSQQGKASGAQWKATIRNSKLGANADEMGLVGVNDLEDGKVYTKQEVLDYLKANEIQVKDVTLGKEPVVGIDVRRFLYREGLILPQTTDDWVKLSERLERRAGVFAQTGDDARASEYYEMSEAATRAAEGLNPLTGGTDGQTHFSTYQLPGAKEGSYREVLLTVPDKVSISELPEGHYSRREGFTHTVSDSEKNLNFFRSREEAEHFARNNPSWRDGHSQYAEIANPIVRLRFNERTTSEGKRMLFLEEVQPPQKGEFEKMPALFQKNWREIAFKWALRHAAENGFDSVGWTTGEMQSDRYDLSKQVSSDGIQWSASGDSRGIFVVAGETANTLSPFRYDVKGSELESVVGKDIAKQIQADVARGINGGTISGDSLKVGGKGLKQLYDVDFRNVVNNLPAVKKAGQKVGNEKIGTGDKPEFILWGDQPSVLDVFARIKDFQRVWDGPGRTAAGWQNWNIRLDNQASEVHAAMVRGQSYADAMNEHGSVELADKFALGGEWEKQNKTDTVHSLPLTQTIRDSVLAGQSLFNLPQSERAESEVQRAGTPPMSNAALRREVNKPDSGVPAEMARYINALIDSGLTHQIPGLRWAINDMLRGGAQGEYQPDSRLASFSRFASSTTPIHEFFHDVWYFLKPEDQNRVKAFRDRTIRAELGKARNYAEIQALETMLKEEVSSDDFIDAKYPHEIYHLTNEREFFTWLMTDRAAKHFDAQPEVKTFIGKIRDIIQKLWTAFKDAFGLSSEADVLWRKILSGKYEFTPDEGREFEFRELSRPEPLRQAMETFGRKAEVSPQAARRAVEIGQAANVLARQGVVRGTLENLENLANVDATTPQQRWLRDLAAKVLANPFIRNTLRSPVEQLNASARYTGDSIESYRSLKAKPDATPEQISNAAGEAVNNIVSFEKRVQDFNSQYLTKRQSLVSDIAKFTELEMEAYDKLDLADVLVDDFRRMALPILRQSNDTATLQAYTYALGRSAAVRNVLAWVGRNVDLTGAATAGQVLDRIREAAGRSRIQESAEQQIGAERGVIHAVARILALVEPVRERLMEARYLYTQQAGERSTALKQRLQRLVAQGSYDRALEVFERGAEKVGAEQDRARRELDFYARRTRSRLLALRALDETREILNNIVDDPDFKSEKQEIFSEDAQHVRNVMMDVRGATFVLKPFGGMTDELKLTFGNPTAESRASLERIKAYRDRAAIYISDPDSDPAVVEGLKAIFPLLDQFLNPAVAPDAARLLPNFMQKAFHTLARLVFKTERIPYYLLQGAGGTWKALGDATLRARRDMGEQLQRINKQHFPRLSLTLHAALQSHGGITPDTYFEKVWNHLAASRQNFRDIRYLNDGDPIGNGEKVTKEDLAYLEAYRKFHTDLSTTSQNIGKRSFSSFRSVLTGIFFDNDGRLRLPFAHGVDMVNRRQPPQYEIENWLSEWKLARTSEAKMAFLNKHLDRLVIGYVHGVNQADWLRKFRYSYEDQIRETLAESGEQPIDSFETLVERVWEKYLDTEPEIAPTFEDVRNNLLGDFDNIFRKLERLDSTEKQSDPKNIVETVRSEREFNTERGDVFMPPNWYDYGGVTEGQWSSVSRASMFPYERAHLTAIEGLKESLSGIVKDFQAQAAARGGFRGYFKTKRESRKARERGDLIYSWADAKDLLEKVTHYAAGLKMMAESPNLLTQTDRPYAILQSGVTQLPVAMVLFRLGAASRNLFGGYTNAVLADMQFRNRSWPMAVAARTGELVADTYRNLLTALVHEGNPVGRKLHSILSDASNWAIVGPVAENFLKAIEDQRQLYRDAAELGLNLNVALWDSLSTLRKFAKTAGNVREPSSPLERVYSVPAAALRAGGLVFGQAGVGRIDSWINAKALVQARQYEQIYKNLARKYGEQVMAIGAKQFPPGAFGGFTEGGKEHKALRVREFFTRMVGLDIDAAMLDYYRRWSEAKAREEAEGVDAGTYTDSIDLFTEDQRNTMAVAAADDFNLATFSNRPYSTKMHAALNTLGLFYGYPDWWIHKLLAMANTNSRKGLIAGRLENMPFLLNIGIAFAIASILGMEGVEWLKEYLLNQKSAYPTLTDAKTAPAAARAVAGAVAFNLPFIGGAMSAAFDLGYHGSNNPYDLFFVPGLAKNAAMMGVEAYQTGDAVLPVMRFADRYLLPIPSHKMTETTKGTRAVVNTGNILEMAARANNDEEKLKPRDFGAQREYTPATPLITRAMNAIGNGDMAEFQKNYTALVKEYQNQGKADPERNARQALMTRNPISQRFERRPTEADIKKYLDGMKPIERRIVTETLQNYRKAMGIIGAEPTFTSEEVSSRGRQTSPTLALPVISAPSRIPRIGTGRVRSALSRRQRVRGVRTRLSLGRRRKPTRIRIRRGKLGVTASTRRPRRIRISPRRILA